MPTLLSHSKSSPYTTVLSLFLIVGAVVIMGAACDGTADNSTTTGTGAATTTAGGQTQAELSASYQAQINDLEADIAALDDRIDSATTSLSTTTRVQWEATQNALQTALNNARSRVERFRNASADEWEELRSETAAAVNVVAQAVANAGAALDAAINAGGGTATTSTATSTAN